MFSRLTLDCSEGPTPFFHLVCMIPAELPVYWVYWWCVSSRPERVNPSSSVTRGCHGGVCTWNVPFTRRENGVEQWVWRELVSDRVALLDWLWLCLMTNVDWHYLWCWRRCVAVGEGAWPHTVSHLAGDDFQPLPTYSLTYLCHLHNLVI